MTLYKVQHDKNYTVVNNTISRDKRVSWSARGIWLYAFSRQEDWEFYFQDLVNQTNEKTSAVRTALKNLEECGYLRRERIRDGKGRLGKAEWTFYETPLHKEVLPKKERKTKSAPKSTFKPKCDFPTLDNQPLISNEVTYPPPLPKNENIKNTNRDKEPDRKKEDRKSPPLDKNILDVTAALEFCESAGLKITEKDLKIWASKYPSAEIFSALKLVLEEDGYFSSDPHLKEPIRNHAAFVNKALTENWAKERDYIEINRKYAEELKSKGWGALVITKQYCRCKGSGNDWSFKRNPKDFKREIESYIEKQRESYEAKKRKNYDKPQY